MSDFLSKEKRLLLAQALNNTRPARETIVQRRDPAGPSPLSFVQQRLWFLHHLAPNQGHCNTPVAIRLTGDLRVDALRQTLREVVRRHESFRTIFSLQDGEPVQIVSQNTNIDISTQDLSSLPSAEREQLAKAILREESLRPFDIVKEPCVRFRLLRMSERVHWLVMVTHHIVFDTWSMSVFSREMSLIYGAFSEGQQCTLPDLEIQYADYALWEKKAEKEGRLAKQLSYWKEKLQGAPELLPLPLDRPRKPFRGSWGSCEPFSFGKPLSEAVNALSHKERSSIFMILLSALAILIHRYGGGSDIMIGSADGNRKLRGTEGIIGCFMNTLLFRTQLAGDPTFRELLRQTRDDGLQAHDNSDVPFEQVVAALNPKRNPSYSPYSQIMLIVQNTELPVLGNSGVKMERMPIAERFVSQQDLTIHVRVLGGQLQGLVEYNSDLFDQATVQRLMKHFEQLLASAVNDLDLRVSQLNVMTPIEIEQLTRDMSEPANPVRHYDFLHRAIEQQIERAPDRIAVSFEGEQITYSELNRRANQLASDLINAGARPEHRVAICLGRSPALLIGLMGTLKAGAACMPLDPSTPRNRLRAIFRETEPVALITETQLAKDLNLRDQFTICLDSESLQIAGSRAQNPNVPLNADNLAYVLYTSGSTGGPKPVMITHRALGNSLHLLASTLGFNDDDAQPSLAALSPDRPALELFVPLITGGSIALFSREDAENGNLLLRAIEQVRPTAMQATPLAWRKLLDSGWDSPAGVNIFCGGETLTEELAADLLSNGAKVWNLYGSAETTLCSAAKQLERGDPVTIGVPIPNTRAYVLNEYLQQAPIGVPGELCISGMNLARGYLNRPDLTGERFVPDPLATEPGARIYRTDDIARYSPSRELCFSYRSDNQVTLRGFRVKLGEIEAALCNHPAVSQAVVVLRGPAPDKNLIAYVVVSRDQKNESAAPKLSQDLSEFLKMQLPDYMIPATFITLDALLQSPNGKVNRKALPEPELIAAAPTKQLFQAPASKTEAVVAGIWARVLQIERVSVNIDFFALGGDSLKAQRMLAHVERELGIDIPIRVAFANPTVELLSLHIDHTKKLGMTDEDELRSIIDGLSDEEVHALLGDAMLSMHAN